MEKIVIIALDGLEPSLVTETMPNLLQREYGITEVNVTPLQTHLIWATFLTGTIENGIKTIKAPHHFQEKISRVFGYNRVARVSRFLSESVIYNMNLFSKFVKHFSKDDLTKPTIFDLVDKSIALDIPAYNEDVIYVKIRRNIACTIGEQYPKDDLVNEVWELFHKEYQVCLKMLEEDWDLFMVHFFVTDVIGHLCWNNLEELKECYQIIDKKVGELERKIENSVILILSDHGMEKGLHTHTGFYSINKQLNLNSPTITDFYEIIRKVLYSNSSENKEKAGNIQDKKKVLEHLKALGYFKI